MHLIYAYIKQFRNIVNQEIFFSTRYSVTYDPELTFPAALTIQPKAASPADEVIHKNSQLSNVHIIVGKTGAGKTNLLQMIGMPEEERTMQPEAGGSYFLLYEADGSFVIEPYDIPIDPEIVPERASLQLKKELPKERNRMPAYVLEHLRIRDSMRMYRFLVDDAGKPVNPKQIIHSEDLGKDITFIFNGYERHAFSHCPYEETRLESIGSGTIWQTRINAEYHRTALWNSCRFLKDYIDSFDPDNIKRRAALVINCQNWAGTIKQHINERLQERDYWTYTDRIRKEDEYRALGKAIKRMKYPPIRNQFVHDLLTDYALYLREWISYIKMWHLDASGTSDVYQEFMDYYYEKEQDELEEETGRRDKNRIDPTVLPDYEKIDILKRIEWLSMWIDRRGGGNPHGLLWQISDDIKDIGEILKKFDNKYFTNTTFTLPIEEMYTTENKELVEDLFERMEQYRPDDSGIFMKELLPYHFDCISSGEYQLAKVLGGIEEFCVKLSTGKGHPNLIYLLDEPETYMHPEFCRTFLYHLDSILKERSTKADVQIIISTHSPLLLSDVLPDQVTRLDLDSKGYCLIKNNTVKAYFGANIHTILADGFFLNYTIGEFARTFLQEKLNEIRAALEDGKLEQTQIGELRALVPLIGDVVIKRSFEVLLRQAEGQYD